MNVVLWLLLMTLSMIVAFWAAIDLYHAWKDDKAYRDRLNDLDFLEQHLDKIDRINTLWNKGYSTEEIKKILEEETK